MKTNVLRIILIIIVAAVLLVTSIAATRFDAGGTPQNTMASGNIFLYIAAIAWVGVTGWIMATHRRYRIRA